MSSTERIMNTIKWVNDTFCPWGLTPIEDLPEAVPGEGNSCVLARVLKDGFPDIPDVSVGSTLIDFNIYDIDSHEWENKRLQDGLKELAKQNDADGDGYLGDKISLPPDVRNFIREFETGLYPELIDKEGTIDHEGEQGAHEAFKIGCTNDENCVYCNPETYGRY